MMTGNTKPTLRELWRCVEESGAKQFSPQAYAVMEALVEAVEPEPLTCGDCGFYHKHSGCRSAPADDDRHYDVDPNAPACENFVPASGPATDAALKIVMLKAACNRWQMRYEETEKQVGKTRAEIARLIDERVEDKTEIGTLHEENKDTCQRLGAARAEIERLREKHEVAGEEQWDACHFWLQRYFEALDWYTEEKVRAEQLKSLCNEWEKRACEADIVFMAEVETLRKERGEARLRLAKWLDAHTKLVADAEVGRLVRGMEEGTGLRYTGDNYYPTRCARNASWRDIAAKWSANPAEALHATQGEERDV